MRIEILEIFGSETTLELEEGEVITNINFRPEKDLTSGLIACEIGTKKDGKTNTISFFLKDPTTLENLFKPKMREVVL